MTNSKTTKRALLTSSISLLLCFAMLLGTTFAWFTDSATSAGNTIISGNLDVDLVDASGNSMEGKVIKFVDPDDSDPILWEPGCTYETQPVCVLNRGNLALKYQIAINGIDGNAKLLEAIEWTVTVNGETTDLANLNGTLKPGENSGALVLSGHMKEEAGNEYQDLSIEGISIAVYATQLNSESDTFGPDYDKDAGYDYGKTNVGPNKLNVLSGGNATYDEVTKTYSVDVNTVAQGGWNAVQGNYYAGYKVNVAGYGENATVSFDKDNGTTTVWKLADEESDGFIKNGIHEQWTSVGTERAYRYDIDGDGVTDFTVVNDVSASKVEVANKDQLKKVLDLGNNVILTNDIALDVNGKAMTVASGEKVLIDLNGNDIVGTTIASGASQVLFEVKGELTVVGNGTIALYDKSGAAFNQGYENAAIYVNGGVANLNGGVIVCTSKGGAMAYAADAVGGNSTINVNGATLRSSYIGIRSFPTASGKTNTINYNSGVVYGEKNGYDIWTQDGSGESVVNIAAGITYTKKDEWGGMYYID